jgi:hypothetical protein
MKKTTKTEVVDLKTLFNFVADNFFIWNHIIIEKYVWSFEIQNLKFSNYRGCRNYQNKSCRSQKVMQLCSW